MDESFNPLATTVNRGLLKHAVGTAIFCPICGNILDCRSSVHVSRGHSHQLRSWTLCHGCWDDKVKPKLKPETLPQLDILDGRELFKAKRKPVAKRGPRY